MKHFLSTRLLSMFLMLLATASMMIAVTACASEAGKTDKIGVVVSILPQAEFVERVGGDRVDVTVMVPPGADPHTYEVRPAQMTRLAQAKMYAKVGSPVEFELAWMDKLIAQNKEMLVVDCSKGVQLMEITGHAHEHEHEAESQHENEHEGLDPHIWLSLANARIMVQNIYEGLAQVDPAHRDYYQQNRDAYIQELAELDNAIRQSLAEVTNRKFIVYHPFLGYFARDYNLQQIAIEQEGKEPTAAYLARLITEAKEQGIKAVFISPQFSTKSAELIAKEIGGQVVTLDPLAKDYSANMKRIETTLREALR